MNSNPLFECTMEMTHRDMLKITEAKYPYFARFSPFISIPCKPVTNCSGSNTCLIIGGFQKMETQFKSLVCGVDNISDISDISIGKEHIIFEDMVGKNADLSKIGIEKHYCVFSFLIKDHPKHGNCILVINSNKYCGHLGFNIYKIYNQDWYFKSNRMRLLAPLYCKGENVNLKGVFENKFDTVYARSLFFNQSVFFVL